MKTEIKKKKEPQRSLRNIVKLKVKDGQRAMDYNFTVKFWNKLLREGKLSTKNKKCTDVSLRAAINRNWEVLNAAANSGEVDEEALGLVLRKIELLKPFMTNEWKSFYKDYAQERLAATTPANQEKQRNAEKRKLEKQALRKQQSQKSQKLS